MWGDWGKLIVAKGFKKFLKPNKSPNLVTLPMIQNRPSITTTKEENISENVQVCE